jgi:hypothetical protein
VNQDSGYLAVPTEQSASGGLPELLRKLATGRTEWRVQHPVEKCYCMVFDRSGWIDPERCAREWLDDFKRRHPDHEHAKYEVAEVRYFNELEQAALDAADALDAASQAVLQERERAQKSGHFAAPENESSSGALTVEIERGRVWIKRAHRSLMLAYDSDVPEEREWYAKQVREILGLTKRAASGAPNPLPKAEPTGNGGWCEVCGVTHEGPHPRAERRSEVEAGACAAAIRNQGKELK